MECYIFLNQQTVPGMIKVSFEVARGNFKTLFLVGSKKKKNSKWIYLKGVTLATSRHHLGLREVKLKEDTFFSPQVKDQAYC